MILKGANNYTGPTIVSAGTLQLGTGIVNAISNSSSLIIDGGTLDLNGNGTTPGCPSPSIR